MAGMQKYVQTKDRGPSPQTSQPNKPNRPAVAANARVVVKRTILSHDDQVRQQSRGRGQNATLHNQPVTQHQQSRLPRQGQGHRSQPKHDPYDTDAASLDTTQPRGSYVQVGHDQSKGHQEHDDDGYDEGDEDDDEQSDEGEDEDGDYDEDGYGQGQHFFDEQGNPIMEQYTPQVQQEALARMAKGGMFDANDSYPTTTSGNLEETSSDGLDAQSVVSPSPARQPAKMQQQQPLQHTEQLQRPVYGVPNPAPAVTQRASIFERGANARSTPTFPSTAPVKSAPALYSNPHQNTQAPVQARVHGGRQHSGPSRAHESQPHGKRSKSVNEAVPQIQLVPPPALNAPDGEIDDASANASPIVDYEAEELFAMDYAKLRQENFDTVPRGKPSVLSEGMQQKPLVERLEHVHRRLDKNDQAKFLGSLPTTEWEDAGDWFVEQFSSIIKRTKEARQTKRKLAIEFEEEVEKRHQYVAKKQSTVNGALQKMQSQGQGLIPPKSPKRK
ncbi:extracellular mutant protein 11-domain-containing protein [Lophiotrema nucula]|uniref:Extracellular mutant protein 11-domain-containing protein n=1 Tax=Lophiotrema nucula TaxID=690887 RepID=A0A6A5Z2G8_9PLEO|nr:extracellular mutant protein 11-domain-containing protein [Lophiotrema nucula]